MSKIILTFEDNSSNTLEQFINKCVDNMKDVLFRQASRIDNLVCVIEPYNDKNPLHVKAYNELTIAGQIQIGHNRYKSLVITGCVDTKVVCCVFLDGNGFI